MPSSCSQSLVFCTDDGRVAHAELPDNSSKDTEMGKGMAGMGIKQHNLHNGSVWALDCSGDGNLIASAGQGGHIKISRRKHNGTLGMGMEMEMESMEMALQKKGLHCLLMISPNIALLLYGDGMLCILHQAKER